MEMTNQEKLEAFDRIKDELNMWRRYFTDERFAPGSGSFAFIPEKDKEKLKSYFLSAPSPIINPWMHWNDCISALLQWKDEDKGKK